MLCEAEDGLLLLPQPTEEAKLLSFPDRAESNADWDEARESSADR